MTSVSSRPLRDGPRDFRHETARHRCWDIEASRVFHRTGAPATDCILQNREELIALCEWIEARNIRSYLEIGIWTGRLVSLLHGLFAFERVAACDLLEAESLGFPIHLPPNVDLFVGDSHTPDYERWRSELGPIDLVFIDADHSYRAVRRDFEINRRYPHRFLAFHDIVGADRTTAGVERLWHEIEGCKHEIVRPHLELGRPEPTMGIGIACAPGGTPCPECS